MQKTRIIHAERTPGEASCGQSRVETTPSREAVTCRVCLALLGPAPEAWAVGEEREVDRGAHELTQHQALLVQRSLAGADEPDERWRWSSLEAAEEQYVRVIDDGTPIRSTFRADAGVQGGLGPAGRSAGRDEVIAMEVALERAFRAPRTFRDVTLSPADQRALYELARFGRVEVVRTGPGRKGTIKRRLKVDATEIAEQDLGGRLTAHEVGLVVRAGRLSVRAILELKGALRPRRASQETTAPTSAEGGDMAMPRGWKGYEGWKQIADAVGVAISSVQPLSERPSDRNPLPVIRYLNRAILRQEDLDAWTERELAIETAKQEARRLLRRRSEVSTDQLSLELPKEG